MLEYILSKILSDEKLKNSTFMILTKDIRRIKGKILSISNGVIIIETKLNEKIVNEFVIVDKITAIELSINFQSEEVELSKKRLEKYLDELEDYDKGSNNVADLIECIGNSEKECIATKYFLDGNHSLTIKVQEYELVTNEVSIFYVFNEINDANVEFNLVIIDNDSINSIAIPELCEAVEVSIFERFRYINS
ncbi:MAG: hypothetical protein ACRCTZ_18090 [Sarcina sp.]